MDPGEQLLRTLLKEKEILSSFRWDRAIRQMESDPRFEFVRSLRNRKLIFNEYKQQKIREEKEARRWRAKKAREDLTHFLSTDPLAISALVNYRQACKDFADRDVWNAVPDDERRDVFNDTRVEVKKRLRVRAKEVRQRNKKLLNDIFDSIPEISAQTSWRTAQQYLLENDVFNSASLRTMDKLDALEVFMDYIKAREEEEEHEYLRKKEESSRREADNRRAFVELLEELHTKGRITYKSKWQNKYRVIEADPRFKALLSQPLSGSTALDLFKTYVDSLKAIKENELTANSISGS